MRLCTCKNKRFNKSIFHKYMKLDHFKGYEPGNWQEGNASYWKYIII